MELVPNTYADGQLVVEGRLRSATVVTFGPDVEASTIAAVTATTAVITVTASIAASTATVVVINTSVITVIVTVVIATVVAINTAVIAVIVIVAIATVVAIAVIIAVVVVSCTWGWRSTTWWRVGLISYCVVVLVSCWHVVLA